MEITYVYLRSSRELVKKQEARLYVDKMSTGPRVRSSDMPKFKLLWDFFSAKADSTFHPLYKVSLYKKKTAL